MSNHDDSQAFRVMDCRSLEEVDLCHSAPHTDMHPQDDPWPVVMQERQQPWCVKDCTPPLVAADMGPLSGFKVQEGKTARHKGSHRWGNPNPPRGPDTWAGA